MKDEPLEDFINRMRRRGLLSERDITDLRARVALAKMAADEQRLRMRQPEMAQA